MVSFRALVVLKDATGTTKRESELSPVVKVTRKMQCVFAREVPTSLDVTVAGTLDHATKLQQPRKNEVLLAIVSWRSEKELSLLAWSEVNQDEKDFTIENFAKECDLHAVMFGTSSTSSLSEEDLQCTPEIFRSTANSKKA